MELRSDAYHRHSSRGAEARRGAKIAREIAVGACEMRGCHGVIAQQRVEPVSLDIDAPQPQPTHPISPLAIDAPMLGTIGQTRTVGTKCSFIVVNSRRVV